MKNIHEDVLGQSEDALQQKCIFWFHNTYPELRGLLFAVPNGGARNSKEAKKFKQTGVVPGVSDLIFLYNRKAFLIEMKTLYGKQSLRQVQWMEKVNRQGFFYDVCRSLDQFKKLIKSIVELH